MTHDTSTHLGELAAPVASSFPPLDDCQSHWRHVPPFYSPMSLTCPQSSQLHASTGMQALIAKCTIIK